MHIARDWGAQTRRDLIVYTVDHGLRPEARAEAKEVGRQAAALDLPHHVLTWAPSEGAGNQATFRSARHRLLSNALRRDGGQLMLMGHTLDDQLETFLIRTRAGSGWYGLAGMPVLAPSPVWPEGSGVAIGRPLLTSKRSTLRSWLRDHQVSWVDDPSNVNTAFERVRVRQLLTEQPGLAARITKIQCAFGSLRSAEDHMMGSWLSEHVSDAGHGRLMMNRANLPHTRFTRALSLVLMAAANRDHPARTQNLDRLASALLEPDFRGATLGGAQLQPKQKGLLVSADPGVDVGNTEVKTLAYPRLQWAAKVLKTASITHMC